MINLTVKASPAVLALTGRAASAGKIIFRVEMIEPPMKIHHSSSFCVNRREFFVLQSLSHREISSVCIVW